MTLIIRNRTFRALFLCDIFNMLGGNLFSFAFLIYASTYPNVKFYLSLSAMLMILPAFFNAYMGYLADKTKNKKTALLFSSWVQTLLFIAASFLIEQKSLFIFLSCVLINLTDSLLAMYKYGLEQPIMQQRVETKAISSAYGLMQGANSLINIVGKPLGLLLFAILRNSFSYLALANAGFYFLSGFVLLKNRTFLDISIMQKEKKFHFSFRDSLRQIDKVFRAGGTRSSSTLILAVLLLNFSINGILPLIAIAMIHYNPWGHNFGLAITLFNLALSSGILLSSLLMNDCLKNRSLAWILKMDSLLFAMFAYLITTNGWGALVVFFAAGYVFGKVNPKITSILFQEIPTENLGKTNGSISMLFLTAGSLGTLLFMTLANIIGIALTFYIIGVICFATLVYLLGDEKKKA